MSENDEMRRRLELLADEELAAIVLERDEAQWRPEVFDIAASILQSRGVSARDVMATDSAALAQDQGQQDFADPRELATVAEYFDALEARTDAMALQQAGLKAWVVEGNAACEEVIGAKLLVRPDDMAAAMEVLDAVPPEFAHVHCPRCGSTEVEEVDEVLEVLDSSSGLTASSEREIVLYRCKSCNHGWSG
jgi:hypothetical protein